MTRRRIRAFFAFRLDRALAHAAPRITAISMAVRSSQRPPDVVIATLKALAALDYPAYEVIVIDNNTLDPKLWVPVAVCCKSLGSHFKFFHDESVIGAKAGALNLAMHRMDGRTSYLAVVDADYRVKNNFLTIAVHHLERNDIAFVQFPQAYRNAAVCARGVELELRDYFQTFARQANRARAMLLTGTLSVIRVNDLAHVGGWSAQTITEDAELGVRFFQAGRQGLFIDQVVGEGLLPFDFPSLENQRRRWVTGNLQCLFRLKASITAAIASWRGFGSIAVQLSAWLTWWSIPTVVLLIDATTRAAAIFFIPRPK